ncbi:alpha-glucosidase [Litorimonas cladophorae]|uniref:Alpha-glucosidase n=1 Tax=Litorimonas cladophorae TaxID=1220491 RepID=A0A918NHG3_9PROT|nr:glycoside hydrolase family 97 protein [Litorimonas cladophorae]GGX70788.1 alpha-glucosidase [Litorimonas cladophorae]
MSIRIAALLSAAVILTACAEAKSEFVEASKATSQEAVRNEVMESASVSSPDGEINVRVFTEGGLLKYAVSFAGEDAVAPSRLGLRFAEGFGPDANIEIMGIEKSNVDLSWEQPWGERRTVRDTHQELFIEARRATGSNAPGIRFNIRVRAFDDGIGFRYEVPKQAALPAAVSVIDELTEFNLGRDTESWWIPSRMYNRYEYLYRNTPVSDIQMAHTPATFRKQNGTHLSIHEAALVNYSGMSLEQEREGILEASLAPRSDGKKVVTSLPMITPWRTIQIGGQAVDLINSDIILNLNEPNALGDVSYFKPGKYAGIWWDQHVRNGTWGVKQGDVEGLHAATTNRTKRYMDFAAENGFVGVLVEGWNIGWDDDWFNNGDVFSFTETYDDFDIEAVAAYGEKVGTRLIGHHETSGNISNYEDQLEDALDLYQASGVRVIKSGYVADDGNIKRIDENGVPRYEYHDSQHQVDHHLKVVKRAHDHQIAMNPHEPVKDTGLRRTYPNWVSREGARGQEFNAWGVPPNGPDHVTNLIFTRMLSGPMDYTAGAFILRPNEVPPVRKDFPRNSPKSRIEHTLAKELALYVVLYSPIQMVVDTPEEYAKRPDAFQFIKDVPTDWEESIAIDGSVGDFAVIARKDRNSDDWYVGAVTNADARDITFDELFFLDDGDYEAQIYADGAKADYEDNPYAMDIRTQRVTRESALSLRLARSGGFAIRFRKL